MWERHKSQKRDGEELVNKIERREKRGLLFKHNNMGMGSWWVCSRGQKNRVLSRTYGGCEFVTVFSANYINYDGWSP